MAIPRGIDVRQSGGGAVVRVGIDDASGNALGTGTAALRVLEWQADGSLKQLDFTGNAFTAGTPTTPTLALAARPAPDSTVSGLWSAALSGANCANFTAGNVYVMLVTHSALAGVTVRREWQWGAAEGDLSLDASGRVALAAAGLDAVMVTALYNARRALNVILAAEVAKLSGIPAQGSPGTVTIRDVDDAVNAISVAVDGSGNRTGLTLNPPP